MCRNGPKGASHKLDLSPFSWAMAMCLIVLAGCTPPGAAAEPAAEPGGDWPLFRGDRQATGVARGSLPEKLEPLWTFSVDDAFESTAAIAGGTVFVGSFNGKLYAVDLSTGRKQWEFSTDLGFNAAPAAREGLVYIGDIDGRFFCVDARTGKLKWHFDSEAEINSSANFHRDHVLFGSQDGILYCLEAATGRVVWKYESEDQIRCSPTVAGERTFVAGCDGRLHVIDLAEGKLVAGVDLLGPTGCTPAVVGQMAFVGTEGGQFFGIDWKRAETVWTYEPPKRGTSIRSAAAATPEVVVVGSRDKLVHAIDPNDGRVLSGALA